MRAETISAIRDILKQKLDDAQKVCDEYGKGYGELNKYLYLWEDFNKHNWN